MTNSYSTDAAANVGALRIGVAQLARMSFNGMDLSPIWNDLLQDVIEQRASAAAIMDMSVIAQLLGDKASGLALQDGALKVERVYRSPCATNSPRLRLLALAAPTDIGGNTPLEFLLEGSDIELSTLYVVPEMPLPDPLPGHDVAIVVATASEDTREALNEVQRFLQNWHRPVVNEPRKIVDLARDRLHVLLASVPGLCIPATARVSRQRLTDPNLSMVLRETFGTSEEVAFPLIVRPVDSHAGHGLAKLDRPSDIASYLAQQPETDFFISPFVDYRDSDGLFRKYRIVFVDGHPYACHMAVCDEWKIWYLNADMAQSATKRAEESQFMATFYENFAARHSIALGEIARRIGLDYFGVDCAETRDGALLIFEADNSMIVHDMDPPDIFPYKSIQMRNIFVAFATMLHRRANADRADAA